MPPICGYRQTINIRTRSDTGSQPIRSYLSCDNCFRTEMPRVQQVWRLWRAFGRFMGDMVGRAVMTVFYFTIALPFGLAVRFIADPLQLKPGAPRWTPHEQEPDTLDDARRML